jgi:alternate signal-mediated exported protein
MNSSKMIKGSIAGATGVALLMGGFGTYALWSDSENLAENGVQSGELTIDTTAGVYDDANSPAANDWNGATDKMVPGDKVTYTQTFTVKAEGKNLKGTLNYTKPSLTGTFSPQLSNSVQVTSSSATIVETAPGSNQFTFASPFGTATITAVVTYELPAATGGTTNQNKSATLPAAAFTITQS